MEGGFVLPQDSSTRVSVTQHNSENIIYSLFVSLNPFSRSLSFSITGMVSINNLTIISIYRLYMIIEKVISKNSSICTKNVYSCFAPVGAQKVAISENLVWSTFNILGQIFKWSSSNLQTVFTTILHSTII